MAILSKELDLSLIDHKEVLCKVILPVDRIILLEVDLLSKLYEGPYKLIIV